MTLKIWVLIHDWLELIFAKTIGVNMMQCSIEELRLVPKQILVSSDNGLVAEFHVEVLVAGVTEANAVLAVLFF